MSAPKTTSAAEKSAGGNEPRGTFHPSFEEPGAEQLYGGRLPDKNASTDYMVNEATLVCARAMHYAAWRIGKAKDRRQAARWRKRYFECRDRIVLGNRKLIFRAVNKWESIALLADDVAGECHIVLIKAIVAYNPWLGIRFSTYAFTCLMRFLSRFSQRHANDRLWRCLGLDAIIAGAAVINVDEEQTSSATSRLDKFFEDKHGLLTAREKIVLIRRYQLKNEGSKAATLEQVGRELGMSKERVRQVQISALGKLRSVLEDDS